MACETTVAIRSTYGIRPARVARWKLDSRADSLAWDEMQGRRKERGTRCSESRDSTGRASAPREEKARIRAFG